MLSSRIKWGLMYLRKVLVESPGWMQALGEKRVMSANSGKQDSCR